MMGMILQEARSVLAGLPFWPKRSFFLSCQRSPRNPCSCGLPTRPTMPKQYFLTIASWASRSGNGSTAARRARAGTTARWPTCFPNNAWTIVGPALAGCGGFLGLNAYALRPIIGIDHFRCALAGAATSALLRRGSFDINRVCFVLARGRVCSPLPDLHRCPACSAPPSNLVRCQRCWTAPEAVGRA